MKITINISEESFAVVSREISDTRGLSVEEFLSKLVDKNLAQTKKQRARSRLNAGKEHIVHNIYRGVKGYESLEQAYINCGMWPDVETFGEELGIQKVYDEIYDKAGSKFRLPADKIRMTFAVVAPEDVPAK